jgi:outer membrane protein OmpA-like peptidoglycan-associated protein
MKISMIAGSLPRASRSTASGCATYTGQTNAPDDPNRTKRNALIGAAIGAAAGLLTGGDAVERRQHALVGAGVGALAGGAVGAYQDRQEAELRRQMAGTGVDVVRKGDNITLNMPSNITFDFDSSRTLKPQFTPVLDNVSQTLVQYNQTVVEVAGHTDSVGTDQYNQALSERRANSVAGYLGGARRDAAAHDHRRRRRIAPDREQRHRIRPRAEPPRGNHAGAGAELSS